MDYICPTCKATNHDCCGAVKASIRELQEALKTLLETLGYPNAASSMGAAVDRARKALTKAGL